MLKNGQIAETVITDYTSDGQGVCRIDGCAVFVPNAIKDEVCLVKVVKAGKNTAVGKIERILQTSEHRIPRTCPYAKLCGGCQFMHMDYEAECELKEARVRSALERLGGIVFSVGDDAHIVPPAEFLPIVPSEKTESYRNKAQYPVAAQNGRPAAGFYRERTHQVVPIDRCLILPQDADDVKACVLAWMSNYKITPYDETTGKGLIRHIYVRKGFASGEVLVCIVANGGTLPHEKELIDALKKSIKGLKSVVLSVNQKQGNAVLGDKFIALFGSGTIEDTLCGLTFRLSPRSFYQVNHDQAERLYQAAIEAAQLTGNETVLDLYCGTGTITLCLAAHAKKAYGVEIVEQAIADAKENAKRNGIENTEFFCADAGQAAAKFAADGIKPDVIVIDPPRKGVSPDVIDAMVQMAPSRIVYVSCDPATLARDVKMLTERGYAVMTAQPFDLFPHTAHVETVVSLLRKTPDAYVEIEVQTSELDLTPAEAEATYDEIKDYIFKQHGVKVSSLYIAQVKEKLGIRVCENYNKSKKTDAKQLQCPKEKEKMIVEALKHFKMI